MTPVERQDEILQLLYWMRGESIGTRSSAEEMNRLLGLDPPELASALESLVERNLLTAVVSADGVAWELTASGVEEGKRRFVEEFDGALGHESHVECGDPDCDCRRTGPDGCLAAP